MSSRKTTEWWAWPSRFPIAQLALGDATHSTAYVLGALCPLTGFIILMSVPNPNPAGHAEASDLKRGNQWGALLSVAMLGAVMGPIRENWREAPQDSFPLSYYPMFSQKREPMESFYYVVGRDGQGARHLIPRKWIGEGGQNQVRKNLRRIIHEERAGELAKSIAKRLAQQDAEPWSQIVSVAVVSGQYVMDDFFHGKKEPVSENVFGSARVKRKSE